MSNKGKPEGFNVTVGFLSRSISEDLLGEFLREKFGAARVQIAISPRYNWPRDAMDGQQEYRLRPGSSGDRILQFARRNAVFRYSDIRNRLGIKSPNVVVIEMVKAGVLKRIGKGVFCLPEIDASDPALARFLRDPNRMLAKAPGLRKFYDAIASPKPGPVLAEELGVTRQAVHKLGKRLVRLGLVRKKGVVGGKVVYSRI